MGARRAGVIVAGVGVACGSVRRPFTFRPAQRPMAPIIHGSSEAGFLSAWPRIFIVEHLDMRIDIYAFAYIDRLATPRQHER